MSTLAAQQLGFEHQRHQPPAGRRRARASAPPSIVRFSSRDGMCRPLLRLEELLAAGLLADAHAARRVLRVAPACSRSRRTSRSSSAWIAFGALRRARSARTATRSTISPGICVLSNSVVAPALQQLRAVRIEGHRAVDLALLERGRLLVRFEVHHLDVARLHAVRAPARGSARTRRARRSRPRPTCPSRSRIVLHAGAADDDVGAVRDVDDQDDPRLQPVDREAEQLVEADHHAVDRLVAEGAQHLARRRVLDELHRAGSSLPSSRAR